MKIDPMVTGKRHTVQFVSGAVWEVEEFNSTSPFATVIDWWLAWRLDYRPIDGLRETHLTRMSLCRIQLSNVEAISHADAQ